MNPEHARQLLERRREDLTLESSDPGASSYDQHPTDAAIETFERELNASLREGAEATLREVDRALERLNEGNYGVCETCGEAIPDERLEAKPEAEYCVKHQP